MGSEAMAEVSKSEPGPSVTSKVAAILNAFSFGTQELTLADLARRAGLPTSTAYRLATELVEWRVLERAGRAYRIGLWLWEVGSRAPQSATLQEVVLPYMEDLYEATKENVHLAVLVGVEALYIERVTGHRSVPVKSRRAGRMPLHATGVGKVLLAYADDELVKAVLAGALTRYTAHTIVAPGHLRRELADIRRTGVAFANEEMTPGTLSVAAPLLNADGRAVAALSIVVRSTGADLQRLAPAVRTAALSAGRQVRERAARCRETAG
jgi:DNA-binding IclR family transcriptional regulator